MDAASSSKYPTPPPAASVPASFRYDVFLSFRGKDTRNNFIDHLYNRLIEAGIHTFKDNNELMVGSLFYVQLMRAIEESRIYIIVFSKNYASSKWCLKELVKIMECEKQKSGRVIPVFYGVEPSEVRWQRGSYAEAFEKHTQIFAADLVTCWRYALLQAAKISGFDLERSASGSESRLISMIVKEVLFQVKPKKLFVAKHPVGLDSRINDVKSLIRLESEDVCLIGIWGMGGSGKTVIAKALYNQIHQNFDSICFLANVREASEQPNGLVHLQEQLISKTLTRENVKICSVDEGIEMIRERLCCKKVLLVLDDLDKESQIDALVGHRDWFGRGSVIIITTRDQHLLNQVKVDGRYETKGLNSEESLKLFSLHTFERGTPEELYVVLANRIVAYSCGLPLALVVLGSYLCGRSVREWNSGIEKLQKIPPNKIQQILQISYDGLDDDEQREIFLDIAFFFIGMDIDHVTEILNSCGFSTEIGIGVLQDRCLLSLDRNELKMHDLVRDMGREIIRQQFPKEPSKRSRLWNQQDVINVLNRNMGTEANEGVSLNFPKEEEIHFNTENFARMHNLRLLQINNVNLNGSFELLSKEIKWISWQDCSLDHLPSNLSAGNLVALDMQHSKMSTLWQGLQLFGHLKILNLSYSKCLTSTPDFKSAPGIVTLILEGCTSLLQIDPSIGFLDGLLALNVKGCEKITNIPSEICSLRSLGYLNLSGCSNLQELPQYLGNIEFLRELYVDGTAITTLPRSLIKLRYLASLSLSRCSITGPFSLFELPSHSLRRLNLRGCNLTDKDIPYNLGSLSALQELDLAGNGITKLPSSFRKLTKLELLWLDNWSILQSMTELSPNLAALVAKNISASRGNLQD